ncbi:twin-arginine translocase TatA/TatE family subunit [Azospirillum sp. SYSU D00513]|uniref:twin-arginine translocase TatA/TatE family subunit n=1 Tax=Azospirillum sp. SYSU D00513 TaxID=2812561 RepID=UPI001A95EF0B|nr:twin-arginine translocase TatA/TatE family subunit [Azospirillum sp. SYSU D00513]
MGSFSIWHWIIVLVIILLLFGAGKLPSVMGDLAKGVKAFKSGMKDDEDDKPAPAASTTTIQHEVPPAAPRPGAAPGVSEAPRQPGPPPQG